jgi:hypothetical protein
MNLPKTTEYIVLLLLLLAFLIVAVLFLLYQQSIISLIRPENRLLSPVQVWWQLVPLFGLVWQFVVISRLSKSIERELKAPALTAMVADHEVIADEPTYWQGMAYAVLFCCSLIPYPPLKTTCAAIGFGTWIVYWIELVKYRRILKERSLLQGQS